MTTRVIQAIQDPSQRARPPRIARGRNRVSRQLFGPVDPMETRRYLETEWRKDQRVASDTWDFDFVKGRPKVEAAKRYEWTEVSLSFAPRRPGRPEPELDITNLYAAPLPIAVGTQDEKEERNCEKEAQNGEETQKLEEQSEIDGSLKSKQTKITDFMAIRKRNSESISTKKPTTESVIPSKISKYNC